MDYIFILVVLPILSVAQNLIQFHYKFKYYFYQKLTKYQ